jgi:hypothetical protein
MRPHSFPIALVAVLCSAATLEAQTRAVNIAPSVNSAQAQMTLQSAVAALVGRSAVNDITLTGTAERIAGSDDESGTATYRALPGANRLDMNFSSGTCSEIRSGSPSGPVGSWTNSDGISHNMPTHNLMTDPGWFPLFALFGVTSSANSLVTYAGLETRNGASVIHLTASQQPSAFPDLDGELVQRLTRVDVFLDPNTLLPVSFLFNAHPDDNALVDIPVEIRYSNYQSVGGAQIPFHVQKFANNTLALDLQFQTASLNTGITAAQLSAQ